MIGKTANQDNRLKRTLRLVALGVCVGLIVGIVLLLMKDVRLVRFTQRTHDRNGVLRSEREGYRTILWQFIPEGRYTGWSKNGQKAWEGRCKGLRETGITFPDGTRLVMEKRVGKWVTWWGNGVKASEGRYDDGLREGKWVYWYDNGQKKAEGDFRKGERHGQWTEWNEDGTLRRANWYNDESQPAHPPD